MFGGEPFSSTPYSGSVQTFYSKALSITVTTLSSFLKLVAKTYSITSTAVITLIKSILKVFSITSISTITLTKFVGKIFNIVSNGTVTLTKQVGKLLAVIELSTASLVNFIGKLVFVVSLAVITLSILNAFKKLISVVSTATLLLDRTRLRLRLMAVTSTATVSIKFAFGIILRFTVTTVNNIYKRWYRLLSVVSLSLIQMWEELVNVYGALAKFTIRLKPRSFWSTVTRQRVIYKETRDSTVKIVKNLLIRLWKNNDRNMY